MSRKFHWGWLAGIVGLTVLVAFGLHQLDSASDVCEDAVIQTAVSPDARLKAIVYSRSCGIFTAGFTTQVALVRDGEPIPNTASNVYSEDSEYSQPQVSVRWEGSRTLIVQDDPSVAGRITTFSQKRVTVNLDWFRSTNVAVHYADLPRQNKTKK